jgi:hypothetical protein
MDFDAFREAAREANAAPLYDRWLIGVVGPTPSTDSPTAETLQVLTDQLIEYEQGMAEVPGLLSALDDLASRLNYYYDPEYAAQEDPQGMPVRSFNAPSNIRYVYHAAVAHLAESRASLNDQAQIVQSLVSTYTAARAKVEHDLQWQEYVRDQFGVDPASIPREVRAKLALETPDHETPERAAA